MKYNTPVIKLNQPDDRHKFRSLPPPSGKYPYHLNLADITSPEANDQINFHMVGDTGGRLQPQSRQAIIKQIAGQQSDFIYHLGDIVYHYGEADEYEDQFFKPFEAYSRPIFAIAGNHDGDVNPDASPPYKSLYAFTRVFCNKTLQKVRFGGSSWRTGMKQPNIYWTLETPLITIIGLYTNIPKFGAITSEQRLWFRGELLSAPKDRMLMVCLHHAPYSADINHGSSLEMIGELDSAFTDTDIRPDIVLSGHVHNYQRFEKTYDDHKVLPFIVAGSGGFDELHTVAQKNDTRFADAGLNNVKLMAFNDESHGFLKIRIQGGAKQLTLTGEYYTSGNPNHANDTFTVIKAKS